MALINCPDCKSEISDNAPHCVKCGCPVPVTNTVTIRFPKMPELKKNCHVWHRGKNVISCVAGETVTFYCSKSKDVEITIGWYKPIKTTIVPGKKYIIRSNKSGGKFSIEEADYIKESDYIIESNPQIPVSTNTNTGNSGIWVIVVIVGILLSLYGLGFRLVPFIIVTLA